MLPEIVEDLFKRLTIVRNFLFEASQCLPRCYAGESRQVLQLMEKGLGESGSQLARLAKILMMVVHARKI